MNHTRLTKEDILPNWARRDNKVTKGDRVEVVAMETQKCVSFVLLLIYLQISTTKQDSHCTYNVILRCVLVTTVSVQKQCVTYSHSVFVALVVQPPKFTRVWSFTTDVCKSAISYFKKIHPVGTALIQADGQTDGRRDMVKLKGDFRYLCERPKQRLYQ